MLHLGRRNVSFKASQCFTLIAHLALSLRLSKRFSADQQVAAREIARPTYPTLVNVVDDQ